MTKNIKIVALLLLCIGTASLFAQNTADELESLLNTSAVSYGQAARFILEAAEVTVTDDPTQAFEYAAGLGWLPKQTAAQDTARLDGIALLLMRAFDIKGGVLYSLAKNPHYAYREMVYQDIIQGRIDPAMPVNGGALLLIANRVFAQQEEGN